MSAEVSGASLRIVLDGPRVKEANTVTHVAMTGFDGFLGWHTRCAALAVGTQTLPITVGEDFSAETAAIAISGSSRLLHIAGVNRGSDDEVRAGNVLFATQIAGALEAAEVPPPVVVFANSTQVGNGSVYALAKEETADILAAVAERVGARFVDVRLPNLFGEHGRPFYNSVVSTFCHLLATGGTPKVDVDKEMTLLHAQDAADVLLGDAELDDGATVHSTVSELLAALSAISQVYSVGEVPSLESAYARNLFNTYRSFVFEHQQVITLNPHVDARGSLVEMVRLHGGTGQVVLSTTRPGASRAEHYHRRKVERVALLGGSGVVSLRRLFFPEVIDISVEGPSSIAIDVPTMWTHRVTNIGNDDLELCYWTNELFDPDRSDTFPEAI